MRPGSEGALPEQGSEMLAGLAGSEHAQHQHVAGGAVGPRVWRHDIQNAVPLNGAFPDALVLADRVAARMPHQVADRLGDCLAPRPSPRSRSRLGEPCADRFKVLFRGGRKGDGARHLRRRGLLRRTSRRQVAVTFPGIKPSIQVATGASLAGVQMCPGLADHLRLASQPARARRRGFRRGIKGAMGG